MRVKFFMGPNAMVDFHRPSCLLVYYALSTGMSYVAAMLLMYLDEEV